MDAAQHGGRRMAFFGGSFDPPHLGHLAVARAASAALGLDTVLFAPVGAQPLKPRGSSAGYVDRLEMTRLAIAGIPGFGISLADAPKPGGEPNYTLETLLGLRAGLPAEGRWFCLMGADSYFGLRNWHRAAEIPFVAPLIVASRPGQRPDQWIGGLQAALPEGLTIEAGPDDREIAGTVEVRRYILLNHARTRTPLYLLPGLNVEISASQIREQIHAAQESRTGRDELLPDGVSAYIRSHGLYR
jgi:nicotinate-nucleotide adenylyltransferase